MSALRAAPLAAGLFAAGPAVTAPLATPLVPFAVGSPDEMLIGFLGGMCVAALGLAGIALLRARARERRDRRMARALASARADLHGLKGLLVDGAEGGALWIAGAAQPELFGAALAAGPGGALDLGAWLGADAAARCAEPLARLEAEGVPFDLSVAARDGRTFILEGRAAGGSRLLLARPAAQAAGPVTGGADALQALFAAAPFPMWLRDGEGQIRAVNAAFARAVGTAGADEVLARGLELMDHTTREAAAAARREGHGFAARARVAVGGSRRVLQISEAPSPLGIVGLAVDVTDEETLRAEIERTITAHRRTLDQLATAVVMFGADERLMFHNSAYETLFALSAAFLDARPTESEILEKLRLARRVPEQANFRAWREQLREAYRALEPIHDWWHLPGGQMLRVVVTPNAEGGITYLFEDVSEHMALESRYNSLIRIQGETLDGLAEAVAVFGSDGRLRLHNHAFLSLWSLSAQALGDKPHIDAVAAMCRPLYGETRAFSRIRAVVTSIEQRQPEVMRLERADGRVLDGAAQPLPDGGTMVTFRDVTDSVKVERALIERNEALEAAAALKNAFVGHVSYHLRTPLNTLIGYAHMLGESAIGPLNGRQREFLGHVSQSADTLRALIDDILDLATIDAGSMALDLGVVDVRATLDAVAESVRDLLEAAGVALAIEAPAALGTFVADGRRVRQILFNLLSNAIAASPAGGTVTLAAERRADALLVKVRDHGPGIAPQMSGTLFERFEARPVGGGRAGVGLGLSIVRSFMELHGGSVSLANARDGGAVAICTFPLDRADPNEAAA